MTNNQLSHARTRPQPSVTARVRPIKLIDFALQPAHPASWMPITTRDLEVNEIFEVQGWLRLMAGGAYDTITHYMPAIRMLSFFERNQDAAIFKLTWG